MIYLDNNATTAVDPEVCDAIHASLKRETGNPSSVHLPGRKVKEAIDRHRRSVADLIGCRPEEIFFTSGGTESNNLALAGAATAKGSGHIIISAIEHPSVVNVCRHLERRGFRVSQAPAGPGGVVDPEGIVRALRDDTFLISVMHSNNETGVLQPIDDIAALSRGRGILFHTDAAQSAGKTDFTVGRDVDMATIVSHKFYGPKGIGALFIRSGTPVNPILFGAGQELGMRPGTENTGGIAGLGKACEIAVRDMQRRITRTRHLRDLLYHSLQSRLLDAAINGEASPRLPNTLSLRIPGIHGHELVESLKDEVAFSAGSACHAGLASPSGVLKHMGLTDEEALSTVRLSVGKDDTDADMVTAADLIAGAVAALRRNPPKLT